MVVEKIAGYTIVFKQIHVLLYISVINYYTTLHSSGTSTLRTDMSYVTIMSLQDQLIAAAL